MRVRAKVRARVRVKDRARVRARVKAKVRAINGWPWRPKAAISRCTQGDVAGEPHRPRHGILCAAAGGLAVRGTEGASQPKVAHFSAPCIVRIGVIVRATCLYS